MRGILVFSIISVVRATTPLRPSGYTYPHPNYMAELINTNFVPQIQTHSTGETYTTGQEQTIFRTEAKKLRNFNYDARYNTEPIVTKHFYIHSAPEEQEEGTVQKTVNVGASQKVYRIIFIKAPSQSSRAAALTLAQAQNQEKTVIYVLSKKTDAADVQAHIKEAPSLVSKPDVFFIKYKTKEEADLAQQHIKAQYDSLGGSSHVSDEGIAPITSVIGALGGNTVHGIQAMSKTVAIQSGYLPPSY